MKKKIYPLEGFAGRLRDLWLASGKSQKEVACQIGTSRSVFANYIYENNMPNALYLARLCIVFHVSADYLLFGKETNNGEGIERNGTKEGNQ